MNDRELLEKAAKATGIQIVDFLGEAQNPTIKFNENCVSWNPLVDNGDALRLMARLNINVSYRENINGAWVVAEHKDIEFCPESLDGPHEDDATRRAIVRAAAEIGRNMP